MRAKMLKLTSLIFSLTITLVACGTPEQRETWRAIGQASCSMSINCDPESYSKGGTGYDRPTSNGASSARARNVVQTPVNRWDNGNGLLDRNIGWRRERGKVICLYSDGSAVNIGSGICPLSI